MYIAVTVFNDVITLDDLKKTHDESRAKLLGILLNYLGYEYGPQYVRDLWKRSKCKWDQFIVDGNVDQFIESNVSYYCYIL